MIYFQNKGLIDPRGITTFGVTVKETDNPIGYFGTGLKYAIAVCLRGGLKVTLWSGGSKLKFKVKKRKMRGQPIDVIFMGDVELPFTTELGKNWELWMAYREFVANAFDEEDNWVTSVGCEPKAGYTTFTVEGDAMDKIHEDRSTIFLQGEPKYKFKHVELYDGPDVGDWIYYRGMRVYELPKRAMYNYNLLEACKLTEDRTLQSIYAAYHRIAKDILTCENAGLIRQMMEANQNWFESRIDYNWGSVTPDQTFLKVAERYFHSNTSYNSTAREVYKQARPEKKAPSSIMIEAVPMVQRRKLWAALMFWDRLGISISKDMVRVTNEKTSTFDKRIYLNIDVLDGEMRQVAGAVYKAYGATRPKAENLTNTDFLIDTVVDFGERILGLQQPRKTA